MQRIIIILLLISQTSFSQKKWNLPFIYEDLNISFSEFVYNHVRSSEFIEKDLNTRCRKGMFLISFKVSNEGKPYDIKDIQINNTEVLRETTRLRGHIEMAIKKSEPYWIIPKKQNTYWADKEFLLPVIFSMSCNNDLIPIDDSFNSLFVFKDLISGENYISNSFYENSKDYNDCFLLHPVIFFGVTR